MKPAEGKFVSSLAAVKGASFPGVFHTYRGPESDKAGYLAHSERVNDIHISWKFMDIRIPTLREDSRNWTQGGRRELYLARSPTPRQIDLKKGRRLAPQSMLELMRLCRKANCVSSAWQQNTKCPPLVRCQGLKVIQILLFGAVRMTLR